jgi:hypothetical protein
LQLAELPSWMRMVQGPPIVQNNITDTKHGNQDPSSILCLESNNDHDTTNHSNQTHNQAQNREFP